MSERHRWKIKPARSMYFGGVLLWRVWMGRRLLVSALSLESAMQFIGRYERGELR